MEKDPSPLDTLRQLKEWLDAGTITPQEFETLKRKLLFSESGGAGAAAPAQAKPAADSPIIMREVRDETVRPTQPPVPEPPRPPAAPVSPPSSVAPTTTSGPVEDPLLPPVIYPHAKPATDAPAAYQYGPPAAPVPPAVPSTPTPEFLPPREPVRPRTTAPIREEEVATPVTPAADEEVPDHTYTAPARSPLGTILIVGGIVALLAIVAYLMLGNKDSERLTSTTITAADTVSTRPETGPQAEQIDLPPAAAPETVRVAPVVPSAPVSTDTVGQSAAPTTATPATEPVTTPDPTSETTAQTRIQGILNAYYEDLKAAPFAASTYFAPQVERFYTMQNASPAAINDELSKSHFPEFLEAQTQIEPGTLKVSAPVNDGSRVVTYTERSQALRQSLQKHQQTRAQVRVRFDKNFKIVYLRQERLLENTFLE